MKAQPCATSSQHTKDPGRVEAKEPQSIQQEVGTAAAVGRSQEVSQCATGGLTVFSRSQTPCKFTCAGRVILQTQQKAPGPSEAQRNTHEEYLKEATHPERDEG